MTKKPVSLSDGNGGYNRFIQDSVIPDLLKVIERSGLSFEDAKRVPKHLSEAPECACEGNLKETQFFTHS